MSHGERPIMARSVNANLRTSGRSTRVLRTPAPLNPMRSRLGRAGFKPQCVSQLVCQSPHLGGSTHQGGNLDVTSGDLKFDHQELRGRSRPVKIPE